MIYSYNLYVSAMLPVLIRLSKLKYTLQEEIIINSVLSWNFKQIPIISAMCQHDPSKWDRKAVRCWLLRHSRQQRLWVPQIHAACSMWIWNFCLPSIINSCVSGKLFVGGTVERIISGLRFQYWVGLVLHGFSPALVIMIIMIINKSIQLRPNPVNPHKRNKWNSKKPRDCPFHPPAKGGVEIFSASVMFSEVVPPGKKNPKRSWTGSKDLPSQNWNI